MRILGFHLILTAYGFWLPNDPRGSWSTLVRRFELLKYGPATKTNTTRSVAHAQHDHVSRSQAKRALKHDPVIFDGKQALAISVGIQQAATEADYQVYAMAILPDHCHLVLGWHTRPIEMMAKHIKARATQELSARSIHPFADLDRPASPWARNYWAPFIRDREHMRKVIDYVNDNPIKAGLPRQNWKWLLPYGGTAR